MESSPETHGKSLGLKLVTTVLYGFTPVGQHFVGTDSFDLSLHQHGDQDSDNF